MKAGSSTRAVGSSFLEKSLDDGYVVALQWSVKIYELCTPNHGDRRCVPHDYCLNGRLARKLLSSSTKALFEEFVKALLSIRSFVISSILFACR